MRPWFLVSTLALAGVHGKQCFLFYFSAQLFLDIRVPSCISIIHFRRAVPLAQQSLVSNIPPSCNTPCTVLGSLASISA